MEAEGQFFICFINMELSRLLFTIHRMLFAFQSCGSASGNCELKEAFYNVCARASPKAQTVIQRVK